MKKFIPYILIAWSLLIFVGYNVLTVEATTTAPNQMLINNELYSKYIQQQQQQLQPQQQQQQLQPQQQQQQLQPQQQPYNNNFADFQLFMQFMMYYEQLHGKDYILKIYNEDKDDDNHSHHKHHSSNHHYDQWVQDWLKYQKEHYKNPKERDFLSPENVGRSIGFPGENEPGFIKTPEQQRAEEQEFIAELEDDLVDAKTPEQKEKIQGQLDAAREKFGKDKEKLTGYDEEGRQLNVINGDYDEEPKQKNEREWYYNENTGSYEYMTDKEIKDHNMESESGIMQGEKWGPETPIEPPSEPYPTTEEPEQWLKSPTITLADDEDDNNNNAEEATEQEEDNNQVNTDTEDSSDNTDSSDSQDSSDSEDNSSDDGGDSSDSGDDSSDSGDDSSDSGDDSSDSGDDSSDSGDGGDSGDSSESEE